MLSVKSRVMRDAHFVNGFAQSAAAACDRFVKAKFHYASWFEAGSKLVADRFEAKSHYAIWFEPASNQLRTNYSVLEFGFYISRDRIDNAKCKLIVVTAVCLCMSVCLSVPRRAFPHYRTDSDVTSANGRGCPLVVHYWADLQSVHGFRCFDNIAPNVSCHQRVLRTRSLPGFLYKQSCRT